MQETIESIPGRSSGNTLVGALPRNSWLDTQDLSTRTLKRRSDATNGTDNELAHHRREPQNHYSSQSRPPIDSVTLPQRDGNRATEAMPTDRTFSVAYSETVPERHSEAPTLASGTALQRSPRSVENHVHMDRAAEAYASPSQADEPWTAQNISSLGEVAPVNIGMLPDHVLSPSVSSSYNLEDGIFEPGSAYQNLFQSLRSHVFRTAQIENDAPEASYVSSSRWNPNAASHSDTLDDRPNEIAGHATRNSDAVDIPTFELPPAQEYLLWKAWTEEVSIWVYDSFS